MKKPLSREQQIELMDSAVKRNDIRVERWKSDLLINYILLMLPYKREAYKTLLDLCDELVSEGKLKDADDLLRLISVSMRTNNV